jgi:hypothetical protein
VGNTLLYAKHTIKDIKMTLKAIKDSRMPLEEVEDNMNGFLGVLGQFI